MHSSSRNAPDIDRPRLRAAGWLLALIACAASAAEYGSLTLEQAIRVLETQGLSVLYSSDLIKPWMRVREEPRSTAPQAILAEILLPYELAVRDGPDGTLMVIRAPPSPAGHIVGSLRRGGGAPVAGATVRLIGSERRTRTDEAGAFRLGPLPPGRYLLDVDAPGLTVARQPAVVDPGATARVELVAVEPRPPDLEEIVVNASQHLLARSPTASLTSYSGADLQLLPDTGDDPLRAVARLPGAASADFTAKSNLRGGEVDETLIRFDDLRLYNPFHFKDFQSTFSIIDPRLVSEIDIYTGGFPAAYGDRMSGVIDIEPLRHDASAYREVSLSFFNASALAAGRFDGDDGDWVVSARRSNLDLIFDVVARELGSPAYVDVYARIDRQLTPALKLSGNLLVFDDDVELTDNDQEERALADYRDEYYWLRFDYEPADGLTGRLLLARSQLEHQRSGGADQAGISRGELSDGRSFQIDSVQTDWSWRLAPDYLLQVGGEWRGMEGRYAYRDEVEFALLFDTPGAATETSRSRALESRPEGAQYGLYANLRLEATDRITAEAGLRWDRESLSPAEDQQFSPRLSLLYRPNERTRLRASWGRFFQAQAIHELPISDGITEFFPAQRSDHFVVSAEHRYDNGIELRLEAYRKDYRELNPRFENLLNTIVVLPELKPDRIRIDPDRAVATGAELSLRRHDRGPLSWWLNYSWSKVEDEFAGEEVLRSWDQTHSLGGGIAWRGQRWDLTLAGLYRTGWPTTNVTLTETDPVPRVLTGARNGERLGGYRRVDLRVARSFDLDRAGLLTVFLEINNVFNESNPCCVKHEIEEEDGPIVLDVETVDYLRAVPSLGFIWQF